MKDDIKVIITLGFSAILVLMFVLVFVALSQLQALNRSMSTLVKETNAKMEAAHTMRDAIRLRSGTLRERRLPRPAVVGLAATFLLLVLVTGEDDNHESRFYLFL